MTSGGGVTVSLAEEDLMMKKLDESRTSTATTASERF
jgi:hypothetical protein